MATVSEVLWSGSGEPTRCPECGREGVVLGTVNLDHPSFRKPRCIDCSFGPPKWLWLDCPECGWWQPGEVCDGCGAAIRTHGEGDRP